MVVSGQLFGVPLRHLTGGPTPPTSFLGPCLCFVIVFGGPKKVSGQFRNEIVASAVVEWLVLERF